MLSCLNRLSVLMAGLLVLSAVSVGAREIEGVNKDQIEVVLIPDKPAIMLGEPTFLSFTVRNRSDRDLQVVVGGDYRNDLGRPESFTIAVTGEGGKGVPQPVAGVSAGGFLMPEKIPAKGSYSFRLFLPHWATFEEVGAYSIAAKRTLELSEYSSGDWDCSQETMAVPVQAEAKLEVVPQDREKMAKLIAKLGGAMLGGQSDEAETAARTLLYVRDEGVVLYFADALGTRNYSLKFTALQALAKFGSHAAFQALKKGMETKGEDFAGTTTKKETADQLAENIRHAAAGALAQSPHPEAIPFLLSKRKDPSRGVRLTILHALGKMTPEEALPMLEEMARDEDKTVSEEAKRYMRLLSSKE
jgi:hypothetical protein